MERFTREAETIVSSYPFPGAVFSSTAHLIGNWENQVGDNRLPLRCRSIPNSGRLKSKNDDERNPEDIAPRTPNGSMCFEREREKPGKSARAGRLVKGKQEN